MSRRRPRVRYQLGSGGIRELTSEEIKAKLQAADMLIATGGRSMLVKILKNSKDKKLLEYGLDNVLRIDIIRKCDKWGRSFFVTFSCQCALSCKYIRRRWMITLLSKKSREPSP